MITQETQIQIDNLVSSVRGRTQEAQQERATTFLMNKAFELAYSLGEHKDTKNPEYERKRQEYREVEQRLGEMWYLPSASSINSALVNLEMTLK